MSLVVFMNPISSFYPGISRKIHGSDHSAKAACLRRRAGGRFAVQRKGHRGSFDAWNEWNSYSTTSEAILGCWYYRLKVVSSNCEHGGYEATIAGYIFEIGY